MYVIDPTALVAAHVADRAREASRLQAAAAFRAEQPAAPPLTDQAPRHPRHPRHPRLWRLVHVRHSYS